jgi:hypothetical protein
MNSQKRKNYDLDQSLPIARADAIPEQVTMGTDSSIRETEKQQDHPEPVKVDAVANNTVVKDAGTAANNTDTVFNGVGANSSFTLPSKPIHHHHHPLPPNPTTAAGSQQQQGAASGSADLVANTRPPPLKRKKKEPSLFIPKKRPFQPDTSSNPNAKRHQL